VTFEQLRTLQLGAEVTLRQSRGRVTQLTRTWFRIVWDDGSVEAVARRSSILVDRLHVQTPKEANT
jgi:hypothetical protein